MLTSRGLVLGRCLSRLATAARTQNVQTVRSMSGHAWSYRTQAPKHSKLTMISAELVGGFMWWWILWHLWHEHEHITGEFPYPDPSEWTDEELGIPSSS